MSTLRLSEVISCLERTDPTHPPSFYYALEVVKRYSRAKIAKGNGRQLLCKHGKLETLEARFSPLGFQDVFYLARLQLKLPPSSINLSPPSCVVQQTLLKAGYPLPLQCQTSCCPSTSASTSTSTPSPSPSKRMTSKQSPRRLPIEGRRGSRSLTNSPNPSQVTLPAIRRTSSSGPGLPSSTTSFEKKNNLRSTSTSKFSSTSPRSSNYTMGSPGNSSKWTPLLSGLGLKSVIDNHNNTTQIKHHNDDEIILQSPISGNDRSEIKFNVNPFQSQQTIIQVNQDIQNRILDPQRPSLIEFLNLTPLDLGSPEDDEELVPLEWILNESRLDQYDTTTSDSKQMNNEIRYIEGDLLVTVPDGLNPVF